MTNIEIIQGYLQGWSERNLTQAAGYLSRDCVFTDPLLGNSISSEKFLKKSKPLVNPIQRLDVLAVVDGDRWSAVYYTIRFSGQPGPDMPFAEWFRIENDKIVEGALMYDTRYIRVVLANASGT